MFRRKGPEPTASEGLEWEDDMQAVTAGLAMSELNSTPASPTSADPNTSSGEWIENDVSRLRMSPSPLGQGCAGYTCGAHMWRSAQHVGDQEEIIGVSPTARARNNAPP